MEYNANYPPRPLRLHHESENWESASDDFEEFESQILSFPNDDDEESLLKERKFVTAWKAALSFPQTKIIKVSAKIPVAATSFCTTDINRWTRCRRHCILCATRSGKEKILDDLVHKDSLYRFLLEHDRTEPMKSIIVLKQDFRRHRMTEMVDHLSETHDKLAAAKAEEIRRKQKEKDDDLTITVRIPVHMPVHINFVPEKPEHVFPKIKDDATKPPPGHNYYKSHSDSSLLKHKKDEKKAKFFRVKSLEW